ncbi:MAG: hypothetical protein RR052_00635 [Oscillospiraceae bacterium]
MTNTQNLLNEICKTCEMGHNTLLQLTTTSENESFCQSMRIQLKAYDIILNEAIVMLEQHELAVPKLNELARMGTFLNIKISTLANKSTRHIADMLLQGTNMGIIEMVKAKKDCPNAEKNVISLTDRLINMQERNIEELKAFL